MQVYYLMIPDVCPYKENGICDCSIPDDLFRCEFNNWHLIVWRDGSEFRQQPTFHFEGRSVQAWPDHGRVTVGFVGRKLTKPQIVRLRDYRSEFALATEFFGERLADMAEITKVLPTPVSNKALPITEDGLNMI